MTRRWRRLVLITATTVLAVFLVVLGLAVWLYTSGRLATLSQDLLQRLSGREVTLDTIAFTAWDTVVFTNVRLVQPFPGWQVQVESPRLEARYGLAGLFNTQINSLRLQQPRLTLSRRADSAPSSSASASPRSRDILPVKQLIVQEGTLHVHWHTTLLTLQHLEATLWQRSNGPLVGEASGKLKDSAANFQAKARTLLGASEPAGDLQLSTKAVPLSLLADLLSQVLPSAWKVAQGTLDVDTELALQGQTLRGTITATMQQVTAHAAGIALHDGTLSAEATVTANPTQRTMRLEGQASVRAEKAGRAADVTVTNLTLHTPVRLSYTPGRWQIAATPVWQGDTVDLGSFARLSRLSVTMPFEAQHTAQGLQFQGTPALETDAVRIDPGNQTGGLVRITNVRAQLPLRGNATAVEIDAARIQTRAWHWQTTETTQMLPALTVHGSGSLDLRQQQFALSPLVVTLPQLGTINGSGAWHWPSRTVHDMQLQLASTAVEALWSQLQRLLPPTLRPWQVGGHTTLDVHATRLSLRAPLQLQGLTVTWQLHDAAFSHPESTYASEHLNGTLQASATFDTAAGQHTLQGTLTLQPFALLVGSLFPALEANHLTSVVTFSGLYDAVAKRLQVYLAGQCRDLGLLTIRGTVLQPFGVPQYDMQLHLRNIDAKRFWATFMHDATRFPLLAPAHVQGTLNALLHLYGQPTRMQIQGTLDVADVQLQMATVTLRGAALLLPVHIHYPLPEMRSQATTPAPEAYGHLAIDDLRIGSVQVGRLSTRLALQSDTLFFQEGMRFALLGGNIALERIIAQHLLRPQRRLRLAAQLRHLDLQQLPRGTTKLPLAGVFNGDFPRIQIDGARLATKGSLNLQVAGGNIRVYDVQGSDVWSALSTLRCSLTTEQPLSLLRLTEIYPIGDIGGTVHFAVRDLTISAGQPAAFALEFAIQEKGGEKREITLRALNNLLFTTGSARVAAGFLGESYRLPYRYFGVTATLRNDTLQLRGLYHDAKGTEYFMQAPTLGGGVSIVNRVPENGLSFRDFLQRLKATVLKKPDVRIK